MNQENDKFEWSIDGGFVIKSNSTGKEILRLKLAHNNDMVLFQIKDKEEGLRALDKIIQNPPPFTKDLPLVDIEEMIRKSQNLVIYDKRPDDDETGYVVIIVTNYWTGKPYHIAIRAFQPPKEK